MSDTEQHCELQGAAVVSPLHHQAPFRPGPLSHAPFKLSSFLLNLCQARWQWEAGPGGVQHPVEPHPKLPGRWWEAPWLGSPALCGFSHGMARPGSRAQALPQNFLSACDSFPIQAHGLSK